MSIIPPSTEMEWMVYKDLKENEYWKQMTEKSKNDGTGDTEIKPKFSEGEKSIIYDTFKQIDKMIHPNYDNMNLHYYLTIIDDECNHTNSTWILAIKRVIKKVFKIDYDELEQNENTQEVEKCTNSKNTQMKNFSDVNSEEQIML